VSNDIFFQEAETQDQDSMLWVSYKYGTKVYVNRAGSSVTWSLRPVAVKRIFIRLRV